MKSKLVGGLVLIALLYLGPWRSEGQINKNPSVSYEYQVLEDPTEATSLDHGVQKLNDLGAQGWELAGVNRVQNKATKLYFKRLKR